MTSSNSHGLNLETHILPVDTAMSSLQRSSAPDDACRWCDGVLSEQFIIPVLRKYATKYFRCGNCRSLQTEVPYWLEEAYGRNLSNLDTGAAQRNLRNFAASYAVAQIFSAKNLIDLGGGDGLLCRLLRDVELNCFVRDRYAVPSYAQGFVSPPFASPDMVTAFEVVEHLPCPKRDLKEFFEGKPRIVLISTELYRGQDQNWWYISPESGQHVFFYSQEAMAEIGQHFGYDVLLSGEFVLFVRADVRSAWRRLVANLLLKRKVCGLTAAYLMLRAKPGVVADFDAQRAASGEVAHDSRPANIAGA